MSDDETPTFEPDPKGPRRLTWFARILIVLVLAAPVIYWLPALYENKPAKKRTPEPGVEVTTDYTVTPLFNEQYYQRLLELFEQADERIIVAMFVIKARSLYQQDYPDWRTDRVLNLMKALESAHKRGVTVKVVLSRPNEKGPEDEKNKANRVAKRWFNERGMTAKYNTAESVKLHDKVVMIDHRWIVQGSHNWTPGPMSTNVEASLLMEAKQGDQWTWDQYHEDLKLGITREQGQ